MKLGVFKPKKGGNDEFGWVNHGIAFKNLPRRVEGGGLFPSVALYQRGDSIGIYALSSSLGGDEMFTAKCTLNLLEMRRRKLIEGGALEGEMEGEIEKGVDNVEKELQVSELCERVLRKTREMNLSKWLNRRLHLLC